MVLARQGGGAQSLPDFAAEQQLSYHHVAKVAQRLVYEGFLISRRGRNGGMELALDPSEIRIGAVVRALEPGLRLADCANCALRDNCSASYILADALEAFLSVLDQKTLADAARPGGPAFAAWSNSTSRKDPKKGTNALQPPTP